MTYNIKLTPTILQVLIAHQAELDYNDLIHDAIRNNDLEMFTVLIHHITCDVNKLFEESVYYHNVAMCALLIDQGADPTSVPMLYPVIASDYSTKQTLDLITLLLKYHPNLNELNHDGTPLLHMVRNVEIFQLLLNHGADWKLKDHKGRSLRDYLVIKLTKQETLREEYVSYKIRYCDTKLELFEELLDILNIYEAMTKNSQ